MSDGDDNDPFDANEVMSGVWLGGIQAAWNEQGCQQRNITRMCSVCDRLARPACPIDYLSITIDDEETSDLLRYLPRLVRWMMRMRRTGHTILVHCRAGRSRSATAVAAWLISAGYCKTAKEALEWLRKQRPCVWPNRGFLRQLTEWARRVQAKKGGGSQSHLEKRTRRKQIIRNLMPHIQRFALCQLIQQMTM